MKAVIDQIPAPWRELNLLDAGVALKRFRAKHDRSP